MHYGEKARFNGKCSCGARFSVLATFTRTDARPIDAWRDAAGKDYPMARDGSSALEYDCAACGKVRYARRVVGKYSPRKACSERCQSATGHDCECACRGLNHGAGHA